MHITHRLDFSAVRQKGLQKASEKQYKLPTQWRARIKLLAYAEWRRRVHVKDQSAQVCGMHAGLSVRWQRLSKGLWDQVLGSNPSSTSAS